MINGGKQCDCGADAEWGIWGWEENQMVYICKVCYEKRAHNNPFIYKDDREELYHEEELAIG